MDEHAIGNNGPGTMFLLTRKGLRFATIIAILGIVLVSHLWLKEGLDYTFFTAGYMIYLVIAVPAAILCLRTYRLYGRSKEGMIWLLVFAAVVLRAVSEGLGFIPTFADHFIILTIVLYVLLIWILVNRIRSANISFTSSRVVVSLIMAMTVFGVGMTFVMLLARQFDPFAVFFAFIIGSVLYFLSFMVILHFRSHKNPYYKVWTYFSIGIICRVTSITAFAFAYAVDPLQEPWAYQFANLLSPLIYFFFALAAMTQMKIALNSVGVGR